MLLHRNSPSRQSGQEAGPRESLFQGTARQPAKERGSLHGAFQDAAILGYHRKLLMMLPFFEGPWARLKRLLKFLVYGVPCVRNIVKTLGVLSVQGEVPLVGHIVLAKPCKGARAGLVEHVNSFVPDSLRVFLVIGFAESHVNGVGLLVCI